MDWTPFLRLAAAALFAGAIGLDRELRAKPAGFRTNIVVGVAAAAFGYVSVNAFEVIGGYDPSRVASQVVSGIGFLGGGAIFAAGGKPHGLTTAAALWGSAAAGLAAGVGALTTGLGLVIVTVVVLWPLDWLSGHVLRNYRRDDVHVHLVVQDLDVAQAVRQAVREAKLRLVDVELRPFRDQVAVELVVHGTRPQVATVTERLQASAGVRFMAEEALPREER